MTGTASPNKDPDNNSDSDNDGGYDDSQYTY